MIAAADLRFMPNYYIIKLNIYIWHFSVKEKIIKNAGKYVDILLAE